jgi:hypothetical protein
MTKLTPDDRCASCGGLLVPRELAAGAATPDNADYVCLICGRPYRWVGNPPRLATMFLK